MVVRSRFLACGFAVAICRFVGLDSVGDAYSVRLDGVYDRLLEYPRKAQKRGREAGIPAGAGTYTALGPQERKPK